MFGIKAFFLVALFMISCSGNHKQQGLPELNKENKKPSFILEEKELHSLINELIISDSIEVGLVIFQTGEVRERQNYFVLASGDTMHGINPEPAWEFRYHKSLFNGFVKKGYLNWNEASYLYEQITPGLTVTLDSSQLVKKGIDYNEISAFFQTGSRADGFKRLKEKLNTNNFIRFSTPLVTKSKTKAVISMNNNCGRLCGGGTIYILEKTEGSWKVIYKEYTWHA